jgi:hypothetical protein
MAAIWLPRKPGGRPAEILVDLPTAEQAIRDLGAVLEGLRHARFVMDAILAPAAVAPAADDDGWAGPITAWQRRRDLPSCPSTWTPAPDLPTYACTQVVAHATHEARAAGVGGGRLLAAWTDEHADRDGQPYPVGAPCNAAYCGHAVESHWEVAEPEGHRVGCAILNCACRAYAAPAAAEARPFCHLHPGKLYPCPQCGADIDAAIARDKAASNADRAELIEDASRCLRPGEHSSVPEGKRVYCDRAAHHATEAVAADVTTYFAPEATR